ncbi:MAG: SHOCT domain-containing protein [Planctomycetota bacterium]|jgi:putative membrane protein
MDLLDTFTGDILTHWGELNEGMGPGMMYWGHGFGWFMPIMFFAFWITFIVGVVYLIRWFTASARSKEETAESAMDILKKRYARGEIGKEEFEEKQKDLEA